MFNLWEMGLRKLFPHTHSFTFRNKKGKIMAKKNSLDISNFFPKTKEEAGQIIREIITGLVETEARKK